jgi:8-oxo-dGTP diphosphatase
MPVLEFNGLEIKSNKIIESEVKKNRGITLSVDCVIFGFEKGKLKLLTIKSDYVAYKNRFSLIGDLVHPDEDIDSAALKILNQKTALNTIFLEQVKAYGNVHRHPGGRVVTIAYCALININHYQLKINDHELQWIDLDSLKEMAFDHLQITKDCLLWLRKKTIDEPIVFNLLPKKFSLRALQELYSAIQGESLDRRNFRKKIISMGYLVDLNEMEKNVTHRPGKLYKFDFGKRTNTTKLALAKG